MNFAIILGAGQGKRFGKEKQFALLKGKPVIYYSLQKFNQSPQIDKIIVVTLKNRIQYIKQLVKKYNFAKVSTVIVGGEQRQDSVRNALEILPDQGYVAIHDAVRPIFSKGLIRQGFNYVRKYHACVPVIPIYDTIKQVAKGVIIKTLNRANLYLVQTPQFFEIRLLKKAYHQAYQDNYYATDDANLIERLGKKVYTFPGLKENIKITEQHDLKLIKSFVE